MNSENFNIYEIINKLMEELQRKGVPFEYTIDNDGFGGSYDDAGNVKDGSKHTLYIHIEDEEEFVQNGVVNEEKVMGIISTIYHEYRHLEQTERYKYNPDFSKDSINIARMNAIQQNGLSNYYFENYRNDPKEVDATKYGFEEAIKYVKQEYPQINAEKGIEDYVHSYIKEDKKDSWGFHMFDEDKSNTVEEILNQLQERMDNPTRVDLAKICSGFVNDVKLKALLTDEFIEVYEKCSSVEEKDKLIFDEVVKLHPEILDEFPVLQNEIKKYKENQTMVINGQKVEVKKEKDVDFEKTTRFLNGTPISLSKEYEDGSYDKKSKVFVANKGINVSNNYINYTSYRQQYNAKTKTYIDTECSPLTDKNGNVIGEQESIERLCIEDGRREVRTNSSIENENGIYDFETISDGNFEKNILNIDNKLSGSKESIQYLNEDGKETYIYMENGIIGEKITKTERGTTIDVYKDGKPYETYEYDENGKAIIQMAGFEKLPDNYVKDSFDMVIPEYVVVTHQEPEEIYVLDEVNQEKEQKDEKQEISTQKLGKETVDLQKDVEKVDFVQTQIDEQIQEKSRPNFEINEFGEIIRTEKNNFRENFKFDVKTETDERVEEELRKFELGIEDEKQVKKKIENHKVEKGDGDYIR